MKKIIKIMSSVFNYGIIALWIYLAVYFFYELFIRCYQINDNCYAIIGYWFIFPLFSLLAYNSILSLFHLKRYWMRRLVESILIVVFLFYFPDLAGEITYNLEPLFNVDNSLIAPIVAGFIIIISVLSWFILSKLLDFLRKKF